MYITCPVFLFGVIYAVTLYLPQVRGEVGGGAKD